MKSNPDSIYLKTKKIYQLELGTTVYWYISSKFKLEGNKTWARTRRPKFSSKKKKWRPRNKRAKALKRWLKAALVLVVARVTSTPPPRPRTYSKKALFHFLLKFQLQLYGGPDLEDLLFIKLPLSLSQNYR